MRPENVSHPDINKIDVIMQVADKEESLPNVNGLCIFWPNFFLWFDPAIFNLTKNSLKTHNENTLYAIKYFAPEFQILAQRHVYSCCPFFIRGENQTVP